MKVLGELLKEEKEQELNTTLKRAFFSDVPVGIDGHVPEALTILTNLTRSASDKADLLDESAARELFQNERWHADIMATVPWVTTHYLKDPNSRATGCVRRFPENYGNNGQKYLGWSHNANKVSRSHFIATEFVWKNRVTSLFEQFSQEEGSELIHALMALGLPEVRAEQLQQACRGGMADSFPDFVSPESKVLLFPDGDSNYVAVTPLVDAGFQRWVHNLVRHPDIRCRPVLYSRPSLVSSFLATCGGKLYCFYYPPRLGKRDHKLDNLMKHWRDKQHLLNLGGIFQQKHLSLLLQCIQGEMIVESEKQRDERLKYQAVRIELIIAELFSFMRLLRSHYLAGHSQFNETLRSTIELSLIQGSLSDMDEAAAYFLSQLNDIIECSKYSAQLAYHPALLPLFERAIKRTISKINESSIIPAASGRFLHFKRLLAYGANARSNPYVIGLPSLSAWAGLVHAFLCNLGYGSDRTDFQFAVILRKYDLTKGHPLPEQEIKNGKLSNGPVIDDRRCDLEFDLIVQLPESTEEIDLGEDNLFGCMPSRFAGGTLTNPIEGSYGQCDFYRGCDIYTSLKDLSASLVQLPSYARIITSLKENPEKHELVSLLSQSQALPIGSGFESLAIPVMRRGVDGYLHTFAYSALSAIRLTSVHATNPLERSFWSMSYSDSGITISVGEQADGSTL